MSDSDYGRTGLAPGALRGAHVGLIPDGTRRWARQRGIPLEDAYDLAMDRIEEVVRDLFFLGASEVSIYCLSKDNLKRDPVELAAVFSSESRFMEGHLARLRAQCNVSSKVVGRVDLLPPAVSRAFVEASESSPSHQGTINLLVAYDPWDELRGAARSSAFQADPAGCLAVTAPLHLVIRTGGSAMLSNFLPLQSAYALVDAPPVLFNELTARHVDESVRRLNSLGQLRGA